MFRQPDNELRSLSRLAFDINASAMDHDRMFYNGESQTGPADLLRMTLIDSIKTLEDPLLIRLGNPNSIIRNRKNHILIFRLYLNMDLTTLLGVLNGIINQVGNHRLKEGLLSVKKRLLTRQMQTNSLLCRFIQKLLHRSFGQFIEVDLFPVNIICTFIQM